MGKSRARNPTQNPTRNPPQTDRTSRPYKGKGTVLIIKVKIGGKTSNAIPPFPTQPPHRGTKPNHANPTGISVKKQKEKKPHFFSITTQL